MLSIAVVEDNDRDYEKLEQCLLRFEKEHSLQMTVTRYREAESFLSIGTGKYDVIFMDIELGGMDGLMASGKLRQTNAASVLIFITNMAQYAIRGYEVDASDYIVKPVVYESFEGKMTRALRHVERERDRYLRLPTRTGVIQLRVSEIRYIEVMGHHLLYHTADGVADVCGSLRELGETLSDYGFSRSCNSYLVNLQYVSHVGTNDVTVDGTKVPISRSFRKSFMDDFMNRIGE